MIPVTYPSSVSTSKESQMVVFALSSVAGLQRWTDYIPVKFQSTGTANSFNTDGYLACDFLSTDTNKQAWVDYIPVYVDSAATDAWQVSAAGFIPFNTLPGGGLGSSLDFNFAATGTLDASITFTRASTATFVGSNGLIQAAAIDTPRFDYDPVTFAAKGLLIEESRTNLLLQSDTLSTQSVSVSAIAYTLSFYGTGTVTLSGASTAGPLVGSGAYPTRSTLTFTPTAGTLTLTVTGTVQYAQLEAGLFPTSYIPTTTTSLTRSADVAQVNTISPWFNATEGTLYTQATVPSAVLAGRAIASFGRSTSTSFDMLMQISRSVDGRRLVSINDSTSQFSVAPTGAVTSTKTALAYKENDSQAVLDGIVSAVDTVCTIPTALTTLYIGNLDSANANLNGHLQRITYYPRRLSQAELESITV